MVRLLGRFGRIGLAMAAAASAVACGPEPLSGLDFDICTGQQALTNDGKDGATLADGTLALTFDQGPSEQTWELSDFLHDQGVPSTFFVNGKNVDGREWALSKLVTDGHLVGNLTQSHKALSDLATPEEIVDEVAQTHLRILPYVPGGQFFLRAPYAAWSPDVRKALDASPMKAYVGPIGWDIGNALTATTGADFECWDDDHQLDAETCGDLYFAEIQTKKKGIVLLHDGQNDADHEGRTLEMVKYLVPKLKAAGFTFVRVDQIPASAPRPVDVPEQYRTTTSAPVSSDCRGPR